MSRAPAPARAAPAPPASDAVTETRAFASGARVLSIGIASTGLFTFAYLAVASHVLSARDYGVVSLCWAVMFVILSVIYRPIEQLLSRTIADRRARGLRGHPLRVPALIQLAFAIVFAAVALALRHQIEHGMFRGSAALYWILVVGVLAYAGSYFARGWLAGQQDFALYGGLVFLESTSRFLFALAAAVGIGSGIGIVGLGMAVAPFASLSVMPFALTRLRRRAGATPGRAPSARAHGGGAPDQVESEVVLADAAAEGPASAGAEEAAENLSMRRGAGFACSVVAIMLSEQALMNAGVLVVAATAGTTDLNHGLTGLVFNVMLIVRAPLQLFQAVQTSILPHLAGLEARTRADGGGHAAAFGRAVRATVLAIAGFGLAVTLGLLAIGPPVMRVVLGAQYSYGRLGLALVGLGMGLHLIAGTFNQAALARGRAAQAAAGWLLAAAAFVALQLAPLIASRVTRVEVGYLVATAVLCALLWFVYRLGPARGDGQAAPAASASAV